MSTTTETSERIDEPRPAEGTSPADAIATDSPRAVGVSLFAVAKQVVGGIGKDGLTTQASAVAYSFIFAIIPLLVFTFALAATVGNAINNGNTDDTVQSILDWLFARLPDTSAAALQTPIENAVGQAGGSVISLGALLALIGARGAMGSLVGALNKAYRVEETRSFISRQLLAVGLTFATGLGVILAIALFLVGDQLGTLVAGPLGLGDTWVTVWNVLRFPLILVILVGALAALYWAGPNTDIPFRWLSPGALIAVVGWVVVTLFINIYFQFSGSFNSYGVLGGVLAFIFYLYVISLVMLIGGEINATLARRVPQEPGTAPEADPDDDVPAVARPSDSVLEAIRDAREAIARRPGAPSVAGLAARDVPGPADGDPVIVHPETRSRTDPTGRTTGRSATTAPTGTRRSLRTLVVGAGAIAGGIAAFLAGRR